VLLPDLTMERLLANDGEGLLTVMGRRAGDHTHADGFEWW
jgi:hypothetical protein